MRVLAFAAEAWETRLLAGVLRDPHTFGHAVERRLALSDVTTFQYEPQIIEQLLDAGDLQLSTLEPLFLSWQEPVTKPQPPPESLDSWLGRHASRITRAELINCDIILTPWEQREWGLAIEPAWVERIAADIAAWTERQFDELKPDLVLSIERRRLASVAAQVVAESRGISILSLIYSRVEQRWIVRSDGGIGMAEAERTRVRSFAPSREALASARDLASRVERGAPLYESVHRSGDPSTSLGVWHIRRSEFWGVLRAARSAASRHLHPRGGRRAQRHKAIRYEQKFIGISKSELRTAALRLYASFGGLKFLTRKYEYSGRPYVLWALHKRPEDSGTALGRGLEEGEAILALRQRLPMSYDLVVREHPSMIGVRSRDFYRKLLQGGARLTGPATPTKDLLKNASGVAGLSGTVLLEAALQGLPTLALGEPEFVGCISNSGWDGVPDFNAQISGLEEIALPSVQPLYYLAWIFDRSDPGDTFYHFPSEAAERTMIRSVAQRYWESAHGT